MRFVHYAATAVAALFLAVSATAQNNASTCTNGLIGFENERGTVCCDVLCDQCGGLGCGRPTNSALSADDCCSGAIRNHGEPCSATGSAPCVVDSVVTCGNDLVGFEDEEGTVCCDASCDQCGGPGCGNQANADLSADDCCTDTIVENDQLCSMTESAPCVLDAVLACSNDLVGVENDEATVSCDASCDQCSDPGCWNQANCTLSAVDCCTDTIMANDQLCSVTGLVTCMNGLIGLEDEGSIVCCDARCSQCGGPGCGGQANSDLSADDCCADTIVRNDNLCSTTKSAPCVQDDNGQM